MTQGGKQLTAPLYGIVDTERPLPNFLIDRSNPYTWTMFVFSTAEKASVFASRLMKSDPKLRLTFSVIHTDDEFRGILGALCERIPQLKWVHQDPTDSRRSPRRWEAKDLVNAKMKG